MFLIFGQMVRRQCNGFSARALPISPCGPDSGLPQAASESVKVALSGASRKQTPLPQVLAFHALLKGGLAPASRASSRHFQWQSTSTNPI